MSTLSLLIFTVGAALFVGAATTIVWAWRGKRVDDHPLCRKCGFDLTGKPDTSTLCPECGRDVTSPKAVRVGHRRARRGWLAGSATVLALMLLGGGFAGYVVAREVDLVPYEPSWWLARQALSADVPTRTKALRELDARVRASRLDPARLIGAVDRILAIQGDPAKTWDARWGDLVYLTHARGALDDARWRRYVTQMPTITARVRPKVRPGATVPVECYLSVRGGSPSSSQGDLHDLFACTVNSSSDGPAGDPVPYEGTSVNVLGGDWIYRLHATLQGTPGSGGAVRARARFLAWEITGASRNGFVPMPKSAPLADVERDFFLPVQVAADDGVRATDERAAEVRGCLTVTQCNAHAWPGPRAAGQYSVDIVLLAAKVPVPMAFSARLLKDGIDIGSSPAPRPTVVIEAGPFGSGYVSFVLPAGTSGKAQLVLEPSAEAARQTLDITRYSSVAVTLDVDLKPPPGTPSTRPKMLPAGP